MLDYVCVFAWFFQDLLLCHLSWLIVYESSQIFLWERARVEVEPAAAVLGQPDCPGTSCSDHLASSKRIGFMTSFRATLWLTRSIGVGKREKEGKEANRRGSQDEPAHDKELWMKRMAAERTAQRVNCRRSRKRSNVLFTFWEWKRARKGSNLRRHSLCPVTETSNSIELNLVNFIVLVFWYCFHQFFFACVFILFLLQYVFAREAINIIKSHDPSTPLYLYLPYQAVHEPLQVGAAKLNEGQVFFFFFKQYRSSSTNAFVHISISLGALSHKSVCALHKDLDLFSDESSTALSHSTDLFSVLLMVCWQAPQRFVDMYANIKNQKRRIFSGESVHCLPSIFRPCFDPLSILCLFFFFFIAMVSAMDEAIGNITEALQDQRLWEDTLLVFTTDVSGQH